MCSVGLWHGQQCAVPSRVGSRRDPCVLVLWAGLGTRSVGTAMPGESRGWPPHMSQQLRTLAAAQAPYVPSCPQDPAEAQGTGLGSGESLVQSFLCRDHGLFLGAAPLCLDLSVPVCFLVPLPDPTAGAAEPP